MRTMASVWFLLSALVAVQAFGDACNKNNNELSCDDCVRCGGSWCTERGDTHCVFSMEDGWCPNHRERLVEIPQVNNPGDLITPIFAERTLYVDVPNIIDIQYTAKTKQKAQIEILNSTQSHNIIVKEIDVTCAGLNCTSSIRAKAKKNFCSETGSADELVHVKISVGGLDEVVLLKYHVPCACQCSQWVKENSEFCSRHGNYTCGACTCYPGWTGGDCSKPTEDNVLFHQTTKTETFQFNTQVQTNFQTNFQTTKGGFQGTKGGFQGTKGGFQGIKGGDQGVKGAIQATTEHAQIQSSTSQPPPECPHKRGDVQCMNPNMDLPLQCSGNGYCGPCDTCICYDDREGSQYFDKDNYCSDLCMVVSDCDFCLLNNTLGQCDGCIIKDKSSMFFEKYNASVMEERDEMNRKVWVKCNETVNDCLVNYVARSDADGEVYVMVVSTCNDVINDAVTGGTKVPIILAILGIVAAVMAVGGVMLWKHMTALPPVPPQDPGYQNIDAEDCVGENPLYKPPTSSFKNPTYGKW